MLFWWPQITRILPQKFVGMEALQLSQVEFANDSQCLRVICAMRILHSALVILRFLIAPGQREASALARTVCMQR